MPLALAPDIKFGLMTRMPTRQIARSTTTLLEELGFDSVWVGDHIAFTSPILDPFVQLAQAAAFSETLTVGTSVYLLPLRSAAAAAKQSSSLDHLSEGRFIFGVGVGGEFPPEFQACGVPHGERGARLSEAIDVVRKLWTGEPVSHSGRFWQFEDVHMQPAAYQDGGPPIWCGGRSPAALKRAGTKADGWVSYVVTPEQFADGLATITDAAETAARGEARFDTAHLLFVRIDDSYDAALDEAARLLSIRYAMDFRKPAQRYCALGGPQGVADRLKEFHSAGVRHFILDFLGTVEERDAQLRRFANEVRPLLADLSSASS
ncbi:MAG: LLM class flavin-dependent oxidoreductase [Alphaproteobacteria bacterium]|nr:LLM class flavin-dependent oxidoreductase [Alphaproteobacteria bacterium]